MDFFRLFLIFVEDIASAIGSAKLPAIETTRYQLSDFIPTKKYPSLHGLPLAD